MITVGIVGYGNLGKGVEAAVQQNDDMELAGIFTRRNPSSLHPQLKTPVYGLEELQRFKHSIDVLILCGGSATDLPQMTPLYAKDFHVVDSFDHHAKIPEHFEAVNKTATQGKKVALISVGWDPGLFSLNRVLSQAMLPAGTTYTFWGEGVSQGHSDAVRRVDGVLDARQYTLPKKEALAAVRAGENPSLSTRDRHERVCYVVAKAGADEKKIQHDIVTMPGYFADYDTAVHFISAAEMAEHHSSLPHGGFVIRSGETGVKDKHHQVIEYSLTLDSNPEFTASILVAYARAAVRLGENGDFGCKTVFDIPPKYLINKKDEDLRKHLL